MKGVSVLDNFREMFIKEHGNVLVWIVPGTNSDMWTFLVVSRYSVCLIEDSSEYQNVRIFFSRNRDGNETEIWRCCLEAMRIIGRM